MTNNFYNLSPEQVEKQLNTTVKSGLTAQQAEEIRVQTGSNEFAKTKRRSLLMKFFDQFKSFMIVVLMAAALISGVVGYIEGEGFTDAIIILVIVLLNACIGVAQEAKAEKSLEALERLSSPESKVIRGAQVQVVPSRELVPGDVVLLETGDSVPADLRLTEAVNLKLQEAALTGESVPNEKHTGTLEGEKSLGDRDNMAYSSTSVTYGRGRGIVVATGMNTEVGKIATMIQSVPDTKTPLQQKLDKLGKTLAIAALGICVVLFIMGVIYGRGLMEMFMTAVSLAAAAIPEGLPAVSTIVLALGVQNLVKKNAIVRKLPSVETLGSTQIICSDKTGTLTQNRMTVVKLYINGEQTDAVGTSDVMTGRDEMVTTASNAVDPRRTEAEKMLIRYSILANDAMLSYDANSQPVTTGDPTETAMLDLGIKMDILKNEEERERPRVGEIPFDSERKMMTTIHRSDDATDFLVATKGGLDEVLACCDRIYDNGQLRPLTEKDREQLNLINLGMAENALRVLAVAMSNIASVPEKVEPATMEKNLVFCGMLGMIDPPRMEARAAVEKCRKAGIKPVMITGDHQITATAIARSLGIIKEGERSVTGLELEKMTDAELTANIHTVSVYARVAPEHKVRIVKAFQNEGKIVAMTGDGVNDAPALKLADIGIAMGITGTDVSKEAADLVLTDDNFATIVTAVEEGRRIYDNIIKAIQFMLSTNIGEVIVLFVAIMLNWVTPLLPIHILWINLVTDSLPALALSVDPAAKDVMHRKPIDSRKGIMTRGFAIRMLFQGLMIGGLSLTAFLIGIKQSPVLAQTMTFAVLGLSQITFVFTVRTGTHTAFRGMFSNKYLLGAVVIVSAMMLLVLEVPALQSMFRLTAMNQQQWIWVGALAFAPLAITEIVKAFERVFGRGK